MSSRRSTGSAVEWMNSEEEEALNSGIPAYALAKDEKYAIQFVNFLREVSNSIRPADRLVKNQKSAIRFMECEEEASNIWYG